MTTALDSVSFLADGTKVVVEGECQDIVRRVRDGDPTLGWEGNPDLRVFVAPWSNEMGDVKMMFEVWEVAPTGDPYMAVAAEKPHELIPKLLASDTRRRDVIGDAMRKQAAKQKADRAAMSDMHGEMADRLHLALVKENAAGRRQW